MSVIKHVNDTNFSTEISNANLALVDFWAPWCGPCRMMEPILEELNKRLGDTLTVMKMNVDENMVTPGSFGIRGIPTMILFKEWKQIETLVWVRSVNDLETIISKYSK